MGDTRSSRYLLTMQDMGMGRMCVRDDPAPFPFEPWGFDCDVFGPWNDAGKPIGLSWDDWLILWDADRYEERLRVALNVPSDPYIAVCPDIPGAGLTSLEFSLFWRKTLPAHWPWYFAVQDGMAREDVLKVLHLFSGIFLGGSDKFKGTAQYWCDTAHTYGKKFHYGRAGTLRKVTHAYMVGADSCDSSFPLWTRERFSRFVGHCGGLPKQGCLEVEAAIWKHKRGEG